MQISAEKGLLVEKIAIDPEKGNRQCNAVITHAHADHVALNNESNFICSEKTKAIIESRFRQMQKSTALQFKEKLAIDGATISLHNSGHILGSAQVLVEGNQTIAVTSDFKLQDSLIQKQAAVLPCDILVIESTFGLPCHSFPERGQVYNEMGDWVKKSSKNSFVVLAGYALGKAQELTAIVNRYAGIVPLVHESVFLNNKTYEQLGVKLGDYIKLNHNLNESSVLIMPPSLLDRHLLQFLGLSLHKKVHSAIATGWTFKSSYDKLFQLSDHADFSQLMQYIQQAKPKLVLTMHGFEQEFASYVQRRLGIAAKPLGMHEQKTLVEYA